MPLRDHFRPPLDDEHSWQALHAGWPMTIAVNLNRRLPKRFIAAPQTNLGSLTEIDVLGYDRANPPLSTFEDGGAATAVWAPPKPTLDIATELVGQDVYEVRVYDVVRKRRLVAAIEIVSPSNKDRPENRYEFVAKCASLLRERVSVAMVDLVTTRHFNLYAELLELIGETDPSMGEGPPATYASACRWIGQNGTARLQTWSHVLAVGSPLPTLPIWLADNFPVPLDLELTYEESCVGLRIE